MQKEQLVQEIKKHNHLYWVNGDPEISDDEYDKLVQKLRDIDPNHEILHKIHTPQVSSNRKVKHEKPMLSLNKAYTPDELLTWCKKVARDENEEFLIEPKLDGWSAKYINGRLITRGDGELGDDISDKIPLISVKNNSYEGLLQKFNQDMVGEILLAESVFKKLNTKYKTPRSALQGILGRDDLLYNFAFLDFVSFDYVYGGQVYFKLKEFDEVDWEEFLQSLKNLDWSTDGLVVKLKDQEYSESLGNTSHHPRGQIALKPKNPREFSTVKDVEFFVGKDNAITPVAIVEDVQILGHTIRKASLHNFSEFKRLDVHIGDKVLIERCGEIIPQIKQCFAGDNRQEVVIEECPVCFSGVYEDGYFLYCNNASCPGSLSKRLADSCKRIGLENIGPAIVEKLVDLGIEDFYEIFEIDKTFMSKIPGFQFKSIDNMYNEIQRIKNNPIEDWKVLASLNIPNIGRSMSKKLLKKNTLYELMIMDLDQLNQLENIGPERARLLYDGMRDNVNLDYFIDNFKIINTKDAKKEIKVCFTGKMPEKRSYYEELASKKGLTPTNTVSKDLNLLVAMDINSGSSKIQKAKKLGVRVMSLDEFLQKVS